MSLDRSAMHLSIRGKQLDVGDALRRYVEDNLASSVAKYFPKPIEAQVVFSKDAFRFRADISVHAGRGIKLQSEGEATEPYPAFDAACTKIEKRLRRYKRRLRDHHAAAAAIPEPSSAPAWQYVLDTDLDDNAIDATDSNQNGRPVIIAEMPTEIDVLTVSEAVMRMEFAELPALLFRNRAHGELNMVYRRTDGHVGWVEPRSLVGRAAG